MTKSSAKAPATQWPLPELRLTRATHGAAAEGREERAYQRGYVEGQALAAQSAERRVADARAALDAAVSAFRAAEATRQRQAVEDASLLAVAVARQVLGREVAADPGVIRELVERALTHLPLAGPVEVRMHPADLEALGAAPSRPTSGSDEIKWIADPSLARGGCVVETPTRIVDGSVEHVLAVMHERLAYD